MVNGNGLIEGATFLVAIQTVTVCGLNLFNASRANRYLGALMLVSKNYYFGQNINLVVPVTIDRIKDYNQVKELIGIFPITAILGPRQAGKTTLAKTFHPDYIFDLENPRDLVVMDNPQLALEGLEGLIMIDEVQRINDLWLRGGFPRSYLSANDKDSMIWRSNFISTFLEKDLAAIGINTPSSVMYRFWVMLSHYHGQTLNYSELGRSFGISDKTAKQYISILEDTFMVRMLMPWHANVGKRLVKSPKLYLRDSGIFHALQGIHTLFDLKTNPKLGASWEGFALEELVAFYFKRDNELFFYAAHRGVKLDLYWQDQGRHFGAEFKYMDAPKATKSMYQAIEDLGLSRLWVIYPGDKLYRLAEKITVLPIQQIELINQ